MKVYLVDTDNGELYEDYHHSVDKVFTTYRGATQWLIDEGYEPYYDNTFGKFDVGFYWQEDDEYMSRCSDAKVIEMELEDY
jgi:hypothetical protein